MCLGSRLSPLLNALLRRHWIINVPSSHGYCLLYLLDMVFQGHLFLRHLPSWRATQKADLSAWCYTLPNNPWHRDMQRVIRSFLKTIDAGLAGCQSLPPRWNGQSMIDYLMPHIWSRLRRYDYPVHRYHLVFFEIAIDTIQTTEDDKPYYTARRCGQWGPPPSQVEEDVVMRDWTAVKERAILLYEGHYYIVRDAERMDALAICPACSKIFRLHSEAWGKHTTAECTYCSHCHQSYRRVEGHRCTRADRSVARDPYMPAPIRPRYLATRDGFEQHHWTADFETFPADPEDPFAPHRVYAVALSKKWPSFDLLAEAETHARSALPNNAFDEQYLHRIRDAVDMVAMTGAGSLTAFMHILLKEARRWTTVWFHNGSGFDAYFILQWLLLHRPRLVMRKGFMIRRQNRILRLRFGNVQILDFWLFVQSSLAQACANFHVPEVFTKDSFDFALVRSWDDVETYEEPIIHYVTQDVIALSACLAQFQKVVTELFKLRIWDFMTLSEMMYAHWIDTLSRKQRGQILMPGRSTGQFLRQALYGGRTTPFAPYFASKGSFSYPSRLLESYRSF